MKIKYLPKNTVSIVKLLGTMKCIKEYKKLIDDSKIKGDFEKECEYIKLAENTWCNSVIKLYGINVHVHNPENLPTDGQYVYIGNHQSYFDIVSLLSVVKQPVTVVAKKEFQNVPFLGAWINRIEGIFINRNSKRDSLKAILLGVEKLKKGISIAIFPEGTRSRSNKIGEFHRGSFKLATKAGVPIVPITFVNAAKVYEEVGKITKGVDLHIYVHKPIETKGLTREEQLKIPKQIEEIILSKLNSEE